MVSTQDDPVGRALDAWHIPDRWPDQLAEIRGAAEDLMRVSGSDAMYAVGLLVGALRGPDRSSLGDFP